MKYLKIKDELKMPPLKFEKTLSIRRLEDCDEKNNLHVYLEKRFSGSVV